MKRLTAMFLAAVLASAAGSLTGPLAGQQARVLMPLHPEVTLLDADSVPADVSGRPADSRTTCGGCHDVDFIAANSTHHADDLADWPWDFVPRSGWIPGSATASPARSNAAGDCLHCHMRPGATLPTSASSSECTACHGLAGGDPVLPGAVNLSARVPLHGEVFAPTRISASAMSLAGRDTLSRSWDVHAERLLECADCHASSNNPLYRRPDADLQVDGLRMDPRRMTTGAWLQRPSHVLAGAGADGGATQAAELDCTTCHDPDPTHSWLPFAERHQQSLTCQACHTPRLMAPALETVDWTRLDADGQPAVTWRGCEGDCASDPTALVEGSQPALLPLDGSDGRSRLAPHNLVTSWYWVDESGAEVPLELVEEASRDATSPEQVVVALETLGIQGATVTGRVDAHPIYHGTATGEWAVRSCEACHTADSRLGEDILLGQTLAAGVTPRWGDGSDVPPGGRIVRYADGTVAYRPELEATGLHVLGHRRVSWANGTGLLALMLTLLVVTAHGGLRWWTARRMAARAGDQGTHVPGTGHHAGHEAPVYMYSSYERAWHWLQAAAIMALLGTGLEIHTGLPGFVSFAVAVRIHNALAFLVVANALLAAFYHLASGEIRQYVPEPRGFFGQAMTQARYYLFGIFRGEPHPFEKSPDRKLNPLQQLTYLGILNVLLPLQILTGLAMWGAQRWPAVDGVLGGLTLLAPLHALVAWLFASFLLIHVYLTTTGPTPTAHIRAMVAGWEEGDTPASGEAAS